MLLSNLELTRLKRSAIKNLKTLSILNFDFGGGRKSFLHLLRMSALRPADHFGGDVAFSSAAPANGSFLPFDISVSLRPA